MGTTESKNLTGAQKSVLDFTNDLCKNFAKRIDKNYVCSALSAHIALSMAAYGADGITAEEMRKVLHISDEDFKFLEDYQRLIDVLNAKENVNADNKLQKQVEANIKDVLENNNISEDERSKQIQHKREWLEREKLTCKQMDCIAKLANKVFISVDAITVHEQYEDALSTYFRSKSEIVDFFRNPEGSAKIINDWCLEATNGNISDIVNPKDFDDCTALILVNAVYFKAKWKHEFFRTRTKTFYLSMFKKIKVPTMYVDKTMYYRSLPELNAVAVCVDFERTEKYMEIIIPNRINGLKTIEKNLSKISDKKFRRENVHLYLPKFEVESEIKLEKHLIEMGMIEAFDMRDANFNKICDKELYIHSVLQKAFIKVDEYGCEAGAVTKVELSTKKSLVYSRRRPIKVRANRPFLFRIMDPRLKIPLFIGTVNFDDNKGS